MLPISQTIIHWRNLRGLTQGQLAEKARLPRPNLSAIERGRRDVTLTTLRRLAAALSIRPGVLADGLTEEPSVPPSKPLSRPALERIARLVWHPEGKGSGEEKTLASDVRKVVGPHLHAETPSSEGKKSILAAWTRLRGGLPEETLQSLLTRAEEAAPPHE